MKTLLQLLSCLRTWERTIKEKKKIAQKPKDWFHGACQVVALLPSLTRRDASRWCSSRVWNVMCACAGAFPPKHPAGTKTTNGETRWNSTLRRQMRYECVHRRSASWTFRSLLYVIRSSPSSSLCAVHPHTHTHWWLPGRNRCAHTHAARWSNRPPVFTSSCTLRGEETQDQLEQRGKRWQADGSSALPIQRVVVWMGGGGWWGDRQSERGEERGVLNMTIIRFLHKSQRLIQCLWTTLKRAHELTLTVWPAAQPHQVTSTTHTFSD